MNQTILLIYSILMMGGGYMGYAKAGSKMSLIAGIVSGIFVLIGLYVTKTNTQLGFTIITATCGLLCVSFVIRLIKTQSFMPSGMLLILSIAALIISLQPLLQK